MDQSCLSYQWAYLLFLLGTAGGEARLSMLSLLPSGELLDLSLLSHFIVPRPPSYGMPSFWVSLIVLLHISLLR